MSNSNGKKRKTYIISSDDENDEESHVSTPTENPPTTGSGNLFAHSRNVHTLSKSNAKVIQDNLTIWFLDGVHDSRNMPWRKRWDPSLSDEAKAQRAYEVWVSEIMLQQTRVETVIPYYQRWMNAFPTINALAESNIEAINALWKGLGYYSRAARLLEGAKLVVENFDGKLPDDAATLQKEVPGIGRYSAGAICSIAYGKCVPVLDGNVHRLLSRILALHSSPKAKSTTDILWKAAEAIVKGSSNPGAVNQALIELGSTVCTPKNPKCGGCPIKDNCAAFTWKMGKNAIKDIEDECGTCDPILEGPKDVTIFPMKVEKKAVPEETDVVCTISWQSQDHVTKYYLLRKRPAHGLLAGLWDFPVVPNVGTSDPKSLEKYALELASTAFPRLKSEKEDDSPDGDEGERLHVSSVKVVGSVLHVFSHVKKTFQVVSVVIQGKDSSSSSEEEAAQPPDATPGKWMDDAQREPDEDEECVKPPAKKKQKVMPKKKGKKKAKGDEDGSDSDVESSERVDGSESRLKWTMEANVGQENLGTGTMKVWSLVQDSGQAEKGSAKAAKGTKSSKKKTEATEPEKKATLLNYFQKATQK